MPDDQPQKQWGNATGKRSKGHEMLFSDGQTRLVVELHNENTKLYNLLEGDMAADVSVAGIVSSDSMQGIDPAKVRLFEGDKESESRQREPASDSILGKLQARLRSRYPSLNPRVCIPDERIGSVALGLQREHGFYEYHVFIQIPPSGKTKEVDLHNAIRQELRYIQEEMGRAAGGQALL